MRCGYRGWCYFWNMGFNGNNVMVNIETWNVIIVLAVAIPIAIGLFGEWRREW
jgi:hypothetical protein